jgi:transposase
LSGKSLWAFLGKESSGVKLHLAVDTCGPPHAIRVTTADAADREGAIETLRAYTPNLSKMVKVLRGGGYSGENFANAAWLLLEVEVVKRNEPHTFVVLPKRRVVERAFAWLEKYRRLWKNCERKIHCSQQMTYKKLLTGARGNHDRKPRKG